MASPLATVKVAKAHLGITGKPSNLHKYNMAVHINIYNENEACVSHIQERKWKKWNNVFFDQEAARGKLTKVIYSTEL